jgi:hypothetical protein
MIEDKTGIPVDMQLLIFGAMTLEDGNILQDYAVQDNVTLRVSVRQRART